MTFRQVDRLVTGTTAAALAMCSICALQAGSAQAQTVTENLTADLSGFIDVGPNNIPSPVSAIDAAFTITFNPNNFIAATSSGLTVDSYSGTTLTSPMEYVWNPQTALLSVGSSSNIGYIYAGHNDVVFQFNLSDMSEPKLSVCSNPGFSCGTANGNALFYASGYSLTSYAADGWLATVANGVHVTQTPEISAPSATAALTLFLGGLAVIKGRRQSTRRPIL